MNRPRIDRSGKRSGMSIIETVVALFLFALFIGGACRVILAQRQVADKARYHYAAINIAKNRIEQVRNMRRASYSQIFSMRELGTRVDANGDPLPGRGKFRRQTTITATSIPELLEVEVRVFIQNPITLEFETEEQHVSSYMAKLL